MTRYVIEVGSYDGSDSLNYHRNGCCVYTFEANKDLYSKLTDKTKGMSDYHVFNKAVCSTDGKTTFNICKQGGASSILKFKDDETLVKHWGEERFDVQYSGESYEVETTRLDTFIEEQGLQETMIDFVHIDAQGVDLDCLKSLGKYIVNVKAGILETVIDTEKSIYVGQDENTLINIQQYLTENNFKIIDIQSNDRTNCEYNVRFVSCKSLA